jgi:hypothetical protein
MEVKLDKEESEVQSQVKVQDAMRRRAARLGALRDDRIAYGSYLYHHAIDSTLGIKLYVFQAIRCRENICMFTLSRRDAVVDEERHHFHARRLSGDTVAVS